MKNFEQFLKENLEKEAEAKRKTLLDLEDEEGSDGEEFNRVKGGVNQDNLL